MQKMLQTLQLWRQYGHYRIKQEVAYLVAVSPTAAYMQRTYWWWRYTFPEFVLPSHLPDAPEAPGPCARDAPGYVVAERVRRKIGLWEKKLDNLLLFGHTLPTTPEVAYRQSYLAWCTSQSKWVPVEEVKADAIRTSVPVYKYPFAYQVVQSRLRARIDATATAPDSILHHVESAVVPPWKEFVHFRDEEGKLHVVRPHMLAEAVSEPITREQQTESSITVGNASAKGSDQDIRDARHELRAAYKDIASIISGGGGTLTSLQPRLVAFAQGRVKTFRDAISEFMAGYNAGSKEVEAGTVDMVQDARAFWSNMMHTVPHFMQQQQQQPAPAAPKSAVPGTPAQATQTAQRSSVGAKEHGDG